MKTPHLDEQRLKCGTPLRQQLVVQPRRHSDLYWGSLRQFHVQSHRSALGALAGLTPTPYQSGDDSREQGICKAGNRWIRSIAIEIAWGWLRYQPQSELSRWYERRFGHGSSRLRKIGIVALARKLLVELWKYLETGTPPAGAILKVGTLRAS